MKAKQRATERGAITEKTAGGSGLQALNRRLQFYQSEVARAKLEAHVE